MPKTSAELGVGIAFALKGEAEITVIFKTGLVFITIEVIYHVGVVLKQVEPVLRVVCLVGLGEVAPRC